MGRPSEDNVHVEFVWGGILVRQGFTQIGSFKNDDPEWPLIFITVPIDWAESHPEMINDFIVRATKEFIKRFNRGEIQGSHRRFDTYQNN